MKLVSVDGALRAIYKLVPISLDVAKTNTYKRLKYGFVLRPFHPQDVDGVLQVERRACNCIQDSCNEEPAELQLKAGYDYRLKSVVVAMPDVQNFFHKVLAVIFTKFQYLYFRRKLSMSSIDELYQVIRFSSCAFNVRGRYAHLNFFPIKNPLNKNVNALRLNCTDL